MLSTRISEQSKQSVASRMYLKCVRATVAASTWSSLYKGPFECARPCTPEGVDGQTVSCTCKTNVISRPSSMQTDTQAGARDAPPPDTPDPPIPVRIAALHDSMIVTVHTERKCFLTR